MRGFWKVYYDCGDGDELMLGTVSYTNRGKRHPKEALQACLQMAWKAHTHVWGEECPHQALIDALTEDDVMDE